MLMMMGVLANIGSQDLHDRPVISFRVSGDPLQGVDSTETKLQFWLSLIVAGPELFDCFGKTFGDLSLFGE
jgi:hypothetical protein